MVIWSRETGEQRFRYWGHEMSFRIISKMPMDDSFTDITQLLAMNNFDGEILSDSKNICSFQVERNPMAKLWFGVGNEVKIWFDEKGLQSRNPVFHGFVTNDIGPEVQQGSGGNAEINLAGPLSLWGAVRSNMNLMGLTASSALRMLGGMCVNIKTGLPYFRVCTKIDTDIPTVDIKRGDTLLNIAKSLIKDKAIIDISDELNIRFPHIYPIFGETETVIHAEIEPNIKTGYEHILTDDDIISIDLAKVGQYFSEIVTKKNEYMRSINYLSRFMSLGKNQLYDDLGDKEKYDEVRRNNLLYMLKSLHPSKVISISTTESKGIEINSRVRLRSDSTGIDDTFIVLAKRFKAEPLVTYSFDLGYNMQDLEDFLDI